MAPQPNKYKRGKMQKHNITLNFKNITSFLKILTGHFTGKRKIITLSLAILMLSLANITLTSALSYQTETDISFTFNPTISVSISNNLTIPNLTPGATSDSNSIDINVATNNVYGYNLYATVGNNTYNNTNLTNITTNNNIDYTFTTISPTANLSSLDTDNTWGYSYSSDNGSTWSNYNGLLLYTTDNPTRLNKTTGPSSDTFNFKIAAKSSTTQASGEYSNVINFTAITKLAPLTLSESYEAYYNKEGKTKLNGYYVMQDMNKEICENAEVIDSELQVVDNRDNKVYWIAKLRDGNCWMTQNLDFDITAGTTDITSDNTDLSTTESTYTANNTIYALKEENEDYGYTYKNGVATWIPESSTISYNQLDSSWQNNRTEPYSYDRLDNSGNPVKPDSNVANEHGLSGNYYNWTAALASNYSYNATNNPANSICPKSWRLPNVSNNEFGNLLVAYNIIETNISTSYITNISSVNSMGAAPLYFVRGGYIIGGSLQPNSGDYWSSTSTSTSASSSSSYAYYLEFASRSINPRNLFNRNYIGISLRCLAR